MDFVTLTQENLDSEQLCCIVRTKKAAPRRGAQARVAAREKSAKDMCFASSRENDCAFIEYAPIETAWAPVEERTISIYCLWVQGRAQGAGRREGADGIMSTGRAGEGKSGRVHAGRGKAEGVAVRSALCRKIRLSDGRYGRRIPPACRPLRRASGAVLLRRMPKRGTIEEKRPHNLLHRPVSVHCPESNRKLRAYCAAHEIPAAFLHVETTEQAKMLPCPFNNWAVF